MMRKPLILGMAVFACLAQNQSVERQASTVAWQPVTLASIPKGLEQKPLYADPSGNASAALVRYPKGYHEPRHYHVTCTHTIYILKGRLKAPGGELGPGTFLYSAKNERHGPFVALEQTEILFQTNGKFDYIVDDGAKTK